MTNFFFFFFFFGGGGGAESKGFVRYSSTISNYNVCSIKHVNTFLASIKFGSEIFHYFGK